MAHTKLDALVEDYLAAIRRVQPAGPYNLGGYCIGGMIACEMARRLRTAGENVRTVIMIDPDYNRVLTPWLYWRSPDAPIMRPVRLLVGFMWKARVAVLRALRRAPGGGMRDPKDRRRMYDMQDSLARAFRQGRPQPYEGSVVLLASAERAERARHFKVGWRILAPAIRIVAIAPDHYALFRSHAPLLGAAIRAVLESRSVEDAIRSVVPRSSRATGRF
jgi:thioesterase domain-containing protein